MSDAAASLSEENGRLRAELEAYRARELSDLRQQLADARAAAEHYRVEAQRNADIGRQIAAEAERTIAELRGRISTLEQVQSNVRRR